MPPTSQTGRRDASRRLLIVRIVFYGGVVTVVLWMLSSVAVHLLLGRDPLSRSKRISPTADKPEEIFRCYFDTMLLYNVLMSDFGEIPAGTRCRDYSVRSAWNHVYSWDTHPWYVVHRRGGVSMQDVGIWRYRRYEVWSRCRLEDPDVLRRSAVLRHLATVHREMDELRRELTHQVRRFAEKSAPLARRIRKRLRTAQEQLKNPKRRMKRERNLIKYQLRKWGIQERRKPCPIGF